MSTVKEPPLEISVALGHWSLSGGQSTSFRLLQAAGQNPSDTHVRGVELQTAVQSLAPPDSERMVSASDTQVCAVGQLPSQVSGASTTPLPHLGEQLLSFSALHALGQQLSSLAHPVMLPASTHWRWHCVPCNCRCVHF